MEANECFLLHGIRVILPLNSSISIGATRYLKICSKIEKLIKTKLLPSCGQAHSIENDLRNVESTDESTVFVNGNHFA